MTRRASQTCTLRALICSQHSLFVPFVTAIVGDNNGPIAAMLVIMLMSLLVLIMLTPLSNLENIS